MEGKLCYWVRMFEYLVCFILGKIRLLLSRADWKAGGLELPLEATREGFVIFGLAFLNDT